MNPPKINKVAVHSLTNGLHLSVIAAHLKKSLVTYKGPLSFGFGKSWKYYLLKFAGRIPHPTTMLPMMIERNLPP
jgi:hypothetical protein